MDARSEYVLKILHKKTFINQWINGKYKEKPLIIYGEPGIGKSSLAKYIMKNFVTIEINIDFCKNCKSLEGYLDSSLYKKSITMMFENVKEKCMVFDDLKHIQENDKSLFKQIIQFSKKPLTNPVIYIFNSISHKMIQTIYNRSFPIQIYFTKYQLIDIIKKFYCNENNINYKELIDKSNSNFHNIHINLEFYQGKTKQIHKYNRNNTEELVVFLHKIYKMKDIEEIYRSVISDHNIISLNILENCIFWIFSSNKLNYHNKIILINNIFHSYCSGDIFHKHILYLNDWDLLNHMITGTIVNPILYLSLSKIKIDKIEFNKYLSKSIIYTYNNKLLYSYGLTIDILSFIYSLLLKKEYQKVKNFCSYYQVNSKIFEKFMKYFIPDYKNKKIIKNLFKQ